MLSRLLLPVAIATVLTGCSQAYGQISIGPGGVSLAGQISVGADVGTIEKKTFTCTPRQPLMKGDVIAAMVSAGEAWSITTASVKVGQRQVDWPILAILGGAAIYPANFKPKVELKAGEKLVSDGYEIRALRGLKAGETIPVILIGGSMLSIEGVEVVTGKKNSQPYLTAWTEGTTPKEREALIEVWRSADRHVGVPLLPTPDEVKALEHSETAESRKSTEKATAAVKAPSPTVKAQALATPAHAVSPSVAPTTPKSKPAPRSARVLDASGTESTLKDVGCDLDGAVYIWWGVDMEGRQEVKPFIILVSKGLQLAIPIAAVTKLEGTGGDMTVTYTTRNGEKTFTGQPYFHNPYEEAVVGKSDFGPLKLPLRKIKLLEFSEQGKATELDHKDRYPGRNLNPSPARITLTDGTIIKASWFIRAWSDEGTSFADDFFWLSRGESLLNAPFKDLAKLEFLEHDMVSVTMANGARADMKLACVRNELERTFAGLMGAGEAEYFRVDRSMLKTIEFEKKGK